MTNMNALNQNPKFNALAGNRSGAARHAFAEGIRDGGLNYSVNNTYTMSKYMDDYSAGFEIATKAWAKGDKIL